nr:MAG TPA: hypothetical protein [Caudoviricetes sp.]
MPSEKNKYFKIYVDNNDTVSFDTNIDKVSLLINVLAVANASTVEILNKSTGRTDIGDLLLEATLEALRKTNDKGGEANESNE